MSKTTSAAKSILEAFSCQREGRKDQALGHLRAAGKQGIGRGKITKAILDQMLEVANEESHAENAAHFSNVAAHLAVSARQIQKRSHDLMSSIEPDSPAHDQIMLLDSELNILAHELGLSLQRDQFEKSARTERPDSSSLSELNETWLQDLCSRAVSQLGQDLWVLERCSYKRGGFFVEFGATNGILLSNTYLLEKEFGWNGICAEPNPEFFESLKTNRLCTISDECIGPSTGAEVEFVFADFFGGMVSDIDKDEHFERRESYRASGTTARLTTTSLHDFLLKHDAPKVFEYLSIDTEGSEFAILQAFPFDAWDIRHITVEHNETPQREQIYDLLSSHGYHRLKAKWDDWYYKD